MENLSLQTTKRSNKMNYKEKQIEELAEDIGNELQYDIEDSSCVDTYDTAFRLVKKGWVKIPEDSVVLTREAYEKFLKVNSELAVLEKSISSLQGEANDYKQRYESAEKRCEQLVQSGCEALKQKRKETAEKIINWFRKNSICIPSDEDISELAKQFGVVIEE